MIKTRGKNRLVYVDESEFESTTFRRYGWSRKAKEFMEISREATALAPTLLQGKTFGACVV